jgi:hypothetical protein
LSLKKNSYLIQSAIQGMIAQVFMVCVDLSAMGFFLVTIPRTSYISWVQVGKFGSIAMYSDSRNEEMDSKISDEGDDNTACSRFREEEAEKGNRD